MASTVESANTIEKWIDIHAPLSTVYHQWTQFEEYPQFMEGVLEVKELGEGRLRWRAELGGQEKEWEATIVEQTPDTRISWRSSGGEVRSGMASFTTIYGGTRVTLQMTLDPDDIPAEPGDARDALARRVEGNLKRFKAFLESREAAAGGPRDELTPEAGTGQGGTAEGRAPNV